MAFPTRASLASLPLALVFTLACVPAEEEEGSDSAAEQGSEEATSANTEDTTDTTEDTSTEDTSGSTEESTEDTSESTEESTEDSSSEDTTTEDTGTEDTTTEDTGTEDTTTEDTGTEESTEDTSSEDTTETTGGLDCLADDSFEDNDVEADAALVPWQANNGFWIETDFEATLCEDEDWYAFDLDVNMLDGDPSNFALFLDIIVQGSSWCGSGCEEPELPAAEENTISIELYEASTMNLLVAQTSQKGRINVDKSGAVYGQDLILRVYGPAVVNYLYDVSFNVRFDAVEDECEC
ncbi:hypothetical protein PPSIR1_00605 [Plesiocystis pacifica SIR-1]|uniref:Lipoprotein n=1 Tax=Plesiocystis pacifica SIR-1 TaxID=391625 RepID=A6G7H9_9BACT|nr:hypothetical protein [Plesiocystis pacifica]EDM78188.1 hypothetical protein PPSIR1_00605 [Plesiocystis pacifica SIR-1]